MDADVSDFSEDSEIVTTFAEISTSFTSRLVKSPEVFLSNRPKGEGEGEGEEEGEEEEEEEEAEEEKEEEGRGRGR